MGEILPAAGGEPARGRDVAAAPCPEQGIEGVGADGACPGRVSAGARGRLRPPRLTAPGVER